ncbi:DUF6311 domain-containing protein [Paraburkholderia phymatum]|uniref:DUF6311 domain-containing protein n=1 Tax=Paraburkholderia phymatum TaxID=148447 RepID=A0ACC6TV72_9BURK
MRIQKSAGQKPASSSLWIPCLIGALFFWGYTGGGILDPENINWLLASNGDPVQHYVGWNFFRNEPFFQWPFGKNLAYGEQLGSSIVFTDSIPLLAFIFRPFSAVLPSTFQYFGIWILLCFILQAVFAWLLLSRSINERLLLIVSTCFFVFSPPMIWRLSGHEALMGHWLILAALCIYLADRRKLFLWPLLLSVAALIHAYLCAMCAAIWLADVIRRRYFKTATARQLTLEFAVTIACLVFVMLFAGYFVSKSVSAGGFGEFRMNLLSFVEPGPIWSTFYSTQYNGGDYEGFAFLGVGMLILVALTLVTMYRNRDSVPWNRYLCLPLAILSGVLILYALSDRISFGPYDLFNYRLPKFLQKVTDTFRVSGRFVWPVFYLLELSVFSIFLRNVPRKPATIILAVLLVIQGVDLVKANQILRQRWYGGYQWPLSSAFWLDASKTYKRLAFVIPTEDTPNSGVMLTYASNSHMSVNGGSIARVSSFELNKVQEELRQEVATNHYRDDTLYVFTRGELWNEATDKFHDGFIGIVDGYRVLAPHWKGCTSTCGAVQVTARQSLNVSRTIDFSQNGSTDWMSMQTWSGAEPTGRWTDGKQAALRIYLGKVHANHVRLLIDLHAFVTPAHPQQRAVVRVNGEPYATWTFNNAEDVQKEVIVDASLLAKSNDEVRLSFELPDATSPESLGMKGDNRTLGLFVKRITVSGN